jgi:uncharacterized membrane protein
VNAPPDGAERGDFSQFVGRFHPLVVHFPIALVLLVLVVECVGLFQWGKSINASAGFVLALATVSALAAALLGWMLGRNGGYEGGLVTRHMWGGISLAAALVICCALRTWNMKLYGTMLFATVCLLAWTSDQCTARDKEARRRKLSSSNGPGSFKRVDGHKSARTNSGFRCILFFARGAHL